MDCQASDKIIYFIRHGKDNSHYRGGWSQRPLIREGHLQAQTLAQNLLDRADILNINTIITSDLLRAIQTATPLCQALNIVPQRKFVWREVNNGKLAGMANDQANELYPNMFWSKLEPHQHYPDGESPMEFFYRIRKAHTKLRADVLNGKIHSNVAVFTHSGVINILYSLVEGKYWTNKDRSFNIPYTSVHEYNITQNVISRLI